MSVVSPRMLEDSMHPRLQLGASGRPLNFTVRRHMDTTYQGFRAHYAQLTDDDLRQIAASASELREPTLLSSSRLQRATVLLVDGTSVDASVSPGCVIHAGQTVTIYVLSWSGVSKRAYVVAAAK